MSVYIRTLGLVRPGEMIIVATSGGPDSVCLLHVLNYLGRELGLRLHIAHLDHGLRDAEAAADARYVAGLARSLDLPCSVARRDVKGYRQRHHLSLEEAARDVR